MRQGSQRFCNAQPLRKRRFKVQPKQKAVATLSWVSAFAEVVCRQEMLRGA